jgi:hypothetical protein
MAMLRQNSNFVKMNLHDQYNLPRMERTTSKGEGEQYGIEVLFRLGCFAKLVVG